MDINSYGRAINAVTPGSFAPDIAPGAPKSQPLPDDADQSASSSFKDTLSQMLGNVNDQMLTAQQKSTDLATGKSNDQVGTVKAVEEASLAMQFTMAVRNKIMDAYTEVERMQF
ncbi:MAG: flagellar hook-basal body complex protein FliE [Candidatus Eremiobacteraeota bacterium]|nr:flagellar hook-basal body complex protein FliE [Candidatus Eremiobacteraeota bacterium]